MGAGLYVKAKINGVEANCLVDTGATLTVVSTKLLQSSSYPSTLESFKQDVVTASGSPLDVEGKTSVVIVLNGHKSLADVIVSNIDVDAILGLDYMKAQQIVVDVANEIITIGHETIHLNCAGPIGCYRVVAAEKVEIPARSEMIIEGKVSPAINDDGIYITETSKRMLTSSKGIVARSLVKIKETVPLRLMNITDEVQVIYPGTNVAKRSPVQKVENVKISSHQSRELPSHLQELYQRTVDGMDDTQAKEVAKLLRKYSHIFSTDDGDLGRT
jgi:predicted aspartyl protease